MGYLIVAGLVAFVALEICRSLIIGGGPEAVCKACGHVGRGKSFTRGSMVIELILWICFLLPGLIYSVWRLSSRTLVCRECGSRELIPADSPIGQRIIKENKEAAAAGGPG